MEFWHSGTIGAGKWKQTLLLWPPRAVSRHKSSETTANSGAKARSRLRLPA